MAKQRKQSEKESEASWKRLPESDQRFINALIVVSETIRTADLSYHLLPADVEDMLRTADRDRLFSIIVECLGRLLDAPALARIKRIHGRRDGRLVTEPPARPQAARRSTKRKTSGQSRRRS
jgi:hypothetical protein